MNDDIIDIKPILSALRADYELVLETEKKIFLDEFSILEKGDAFRILDTWRIIPHPQKLYLISATNSYSLQITKPSLEKTPHRRIFNYLYCYLELGVDFPDTMIRPNSLADRLANLFTHTNINIPHQKKFHELYILESHDKDKIVPLLSAKLISAIEKSPELYLEIRNNKCLLLYQSAPDLKDTIRMIDVVRAFTEASS